MLIALQSMEREKSDTLYPRRMKKNTISLHGIIGTFMGVHRVHQNKCQMQVCFTYYIYEEKTDFTMTFIHKIESNLTVKFAD